jgi:hypothetical protein
LGDPAYVSANSMYSQRENGLTRRPIFITRQITVV